MARFGITTTKAFGVTAGQLEELRRQIKRNHPLALDLWETGFHDVRILAALIADPKIIEEQTIDKWAGDFDNWAICDSVTGKLFQKTMYAYDKVHEWQNDERLFVKRASFALIAWIAVHHKKLPDSFFNQYIDIIITHSTDERHYIKKAVNWALRQIGKRNRNLALKSLDICDLLNEKYSKSKAAKWIASDARRELKSKYGDL
ncbi:MAG: DNA alkylation repair protein [Candidatus Kapabacteria bacterium]|nr:DNA alkylation repair protein [Ignavibacteriota bacterium]MCW5883968.1 DNA alkylation repair protein [Candidatus Kapabacteria bacterium]